MAHGLDVIIRAAKKINDNYTVIGFKDMYLLDANSKKTFKWKGYSKTLQPDRYGETTGMARCLNKIVLDTLNYDIWGRVRANASMDRYMCKALLSVCGINANSSWSATMILSLCTKVDKAGRLCL